jgi:hypothetical protein
MPDIAAAIAHLDLGFADDIARRPFSWPLAQRESRDPAMRQIM